MSASATSDLPNLMTNGPKSKKSKKKKNRQKSNGEGVKANGGNNDNEDDEIDVADEEENQTPSDVPNTPSKLTFKNEPGLVNGDRLTKGQEASKDAGGDRLREQSNLPRRKSEAGQHSSGPQVYGLERAASESNMPDSNSDEMLKQIESLRNEVSQLQNELTSTGDVHEQEVVDLRNELQHTKEQKENAESQYQNLLGKVNTIRSQLGERLKADAADLSQARTRIEELEEQNTALREQQDAHASELSALADNNEQKSKELSTLRNRTTLSQQNWSKEREEFLRREAYHKEEFEAAKQAMQDWEVLAMEERSIRENISEKVAELEEQVESQRDAHEKAAAERDSQSTTVDGLQRALQEIQDARRRELRELVENSQTQVENLKQQLHQTEDRASEASKALESAKLELERVLPLEKEVKEKNLLLGKLRHERVTLSDHLTRALKHINKKKPEDSIDKQLITNHFMHFLALERGDTKKFQILQIMANLLNWTDEQREDAGLARPGASNPNAPVPVSPWHRTPSTPALSADFFPDSGGARKESLADLWSGFLEQQAKEDPMALKSPPSSSSGSKPP